MFFVNITVRDPLKDYILSFLLDNILKLLLLLVLNIIITIFIYKLFNNLFFRFIFVFSIVSIFSPGAVDISGVVYMNRILPSQSQLMLMLDHSDNFHEQADR